MDALRASSMMLLVPVHAASLLALNGHPGMWAVAIFWVVHVFRLPLFFAMSGFFMALLLSRKGVGTTLRNRSLRIVVPLTVGLVTLMPLLLFAAQRSGTAFTEGGNVPAGTPFSFEPGFLWFLWYLLIVDGVAFALYLLAPDLLRAAGRHFRALVARPMAGILLLAIPTALALWPDPHWFSAPDAETFVPQPHLLFYNALFFALGATLYAHRDLVSNANRDAWRWVACAVAATVPAGLLFTLHNSLEYGSNPMVHGVALLVYAIATWTSLIALVGLADRYLNRPRPALRWLADSSYWIYLSHMPAMVLVVAWAGALALGTASQFAFVTALSLAFSLITYPLFVRYTAIGRVLNGPRRRRRPRLVSRRRPTLRGAPG